MNGGGHHTSAILVMEMRIVGQAAAGVASIPTPRLGCGHHAAVAAAAGGSFVAVGRWPSIAHPSRSIFPNDPATGSNRGER